MIARRILFSPVRKIEYSVCIPGIHDAIPIIDPASSSLLHEVLKIQRSSLLLNSSNVGSGALRLGVDDASFSPHHRHGGMWTPPPSPPSPSLFSFSSSSSSIIHLGSFSFIPIILDKTPNVLSPFLYWKRNCLSLGLNSGPLDQSPECYHHTKAGTDISNSNSLYGCRLLLSFVNPSKQLFLCLTPRMISWASSALGVSIGLLGNIELIFPKLSWFMLKKVPFLSCI